MDLKMATEAMLRQLQELLLGTDQQNYQLPLDTFNGSTLGQHYRHIIEFYTCLLKDKHSNVVCYDNRKRDLRIETNPVHAAGLIADMLPILADLDIHEVVELEQLLDKEVGGKPCKIASSIGRELIYCYDHCIHHMAIINIGCQIHFPELTMAEDFGVAPSTLRYRA